MQVLTETKITEYEIFRLTKRGKTLITRELYKD